jgi:hypothetical protein
MTPRYSSTEVAKTSSTPRLPERRLRSAADAATGSSMTSVKSLTPACTGDGKVYRLGRRTSRVVEARHAIDTGLDGIFLRFRCLNSRKSTLLDPRNKEFLRLTQELRQRCLCSAMPMALRDAEAEFYNIHPRHVSACISAR